MFISGYTNIENVFYCLNKNAQILIDPQRVVSTVGENLANDLPVCSQAHIHFNRVTPCILNISISQANVAAESIKMMKAKKACGPDNVRVSPRLLKYTAN